MPIPKRMLRWHLYGAGLDSLGKNGAPEEVDVPDFASDQLLVRMGRVWPLLLRY